MSLTFRDSGVSGKQITVFSGDLAIAILWKYEALAAPTEDWRWTFTLTAGPPGFQHRGKASTKDEAEACLNRNWQTWLDFAALGPRKAE